MFLRRVMLLLAVAIATTLLFSSLHGNGAGLAHFLLRPATPLHVQGIVIPDMPPETSLQLRKSFEDTSYYYYYPYYKFIQLYDSSRVNYFFGETRIHRQTGGPVRISLGFFDPPNHAPFVGANLNILRNYSRTEWFTAADGDTLVYFNELSVDCEHLDCMNVGIKDSTIFYSEIVDSISGNVLNTLDTLGVRPCYSADSIDYCFFGRNDTSIVRHHLFASPNGSRKIALRIRPYYSGSSSDEFLVRWDMTEVELLSSITRSARNRIVAYLDSLIALGKKVIGVADPQLTKDVFKSVAYNKYSGGLSIQYEVYQPGQLSFRIYDRTGKHIYTIRRDHPSKGIFSLQEPLRELHGGAYYIALTANERIVGATGFIVLK